MVSRIQGYSGFAPCFWDQMAWKRKDVLTLTSDHPVFWQPKGKKGMKWFQISIGNREGGKDVYRWLITVCVNACVYHKNSYLCIIDEFIKSIQFRILKWILTKNLPWNLWQSPWSTAWKWGTKEWGCLSSVCTSGKGVDKAETESASVRDLRATEAGICIETTGPKKMALKIFHNLLLNWPSLLSFNKHLSITK